MRRWGGAAKKLWGGRYFGRAQSSAKANGSGDGPMSSGIGLTTDDVVDAGRFAEVRKRSEK
jgi:hypothetical protein